MPNKAENSSVVVKSGIIYQAISGFYYVWSDGESYATKPRGNFRHQQMKPLVGDRVKFEYDESDSQSNSRLIEIAPRRNQLVRPTVSNVDYALVVTSLIEPNFSYNLLDYFLVSVEAHDIQPLILLTKYDLLLEQKGQVEAEALVGEITELYAEVGYKVVVLDGTKASYDRLGTHIEDALYVIMGQSGVGKSTLLNHMLPDAQIETSAISDALNRGRHTTREVTLYRYNEGLLADTPGFSAIEFTTLEKEELQTCFPEILEATNDCKFRSCLHINEPGCAVKAQWEAGEIAESRYQNYLQIFERIEQRKPVYRKKN